MSILNNNFDIIGHDPHANAGGSLTTVLEVKDAPTPYDDIAASGTPKPGAIFVGALVVMGTDGKAVLADQDNKAGGDSSTAFPCMVFVTTDGDKDYDGAFVHKITCIQGGAEFQLDQANFKSATYTPTQWLTFGAAGDSEAGMFRVAAAGEQLVGMVGQLGQDTTKATLHVIIPQGILAEL